MSFPGQRGPRKFFLSRAAYGTTPTLASVTPNADRLAGGTSITLTGQYFRNNADGTAPLVFFGAQPGVNVVVVDANTITVDSAIAVESGLVDISVTIDSQIATLADAFTYFETIISTDQVSPAYGLLAGGTRVMIAGLNFEDGNTITFNGVPATDVTFIDDRHYTAVTGAATTAGFGDIVMNALSGAVITLRNGWQYVNSIRDDNIITSSIRRNPGMSIRRPLDGPRTASFTVYNANRPQPPEKCRIIDNFDSDRLLFGGTVMSSTQIFGNNAGDGATNELAWQVDAVGFSWLFNKRRPFGVYENVSVSDIVKDLVSKFAPEFTTVHVQSNLAKVSITLDGQRDLTTVLQVLGKAIGGGHAYIDDDMDVHFFHVVPPGADIKLPPAFVAPTRAAALTFSLGADIQQIQGLPPVPNKQTIITWQVSFVYDNGVQSQLSYASPPILVDGTKAYVFAGIPIGPPVGTHLCVSRRIWVNYFNQSIFTGSMYTISDNVLTAFTDEGMVGTSAPGYTLSGLVAALQASKDANTLVADWGPIIGFGDAAALQNAPGPIPNTYTSLADVIGYADLDFLMSSGTVNPTLPSVVSRTSFNQFVPMPSPYVAPPAYNSTQPMIVTQGSELPVTPTGQTVTYTPSSFFSADPAHAYAFCLANLYADMTLSRQGPLTFVELDGVHDLVFQNLAIGTDVNTVACIGRVLIWVTRPGSKDETRYGWAVLDNVVDSYEASLFQFSFALPAFGTRANVPTPPVWPNDDGPDLELFDVPDELNNTTNTTLLRNQPIRSSVDASQVRNLIHVMGASTTTNLPSFVGDSLIYVTDTSIFTVSGGSMFMKGQIFEYTGLSVAVGPGVIFLRDSLLTDITEGLSVQLYMKVEDVESQKILAQVEKDRNGNALDGIHEFTINDASLSTPWQLYMRGYAELELFSRVIVTLDYATRDPKSRSGAMVHANLSDPPVFGDFLIQDVSIDQIRDESDDLEPRYTVRASNVRFTLDDLLLLIVAQGQSAPSSYSGTVGMATTIASSGGDFDIKKRYGGCSHTLAVGGGNPVVTPYGAALSMAFVATASYTSDEFPIGDPPTVADQGNWVTCQTSSVLNNSHGLGGGTQIRLEGNIDMVWRVRTGALITQLFFFAGLLQGGASAPTTGDPGQACACFRYDPAQDGGWVGITWNNGGGAGANIITRTAVVAPVLPLTEYDLRMVTSGVVRAGVTSLTLSFQVNGSPFQTLTYDATKYGTFSDPQHRTMPISGTTGILVPKLFVVTKTTAPRRIYFKNFGVSMDN